MGDLQGAVSLSLSTSSSAQALAWAVSLWKIPSHVARDWVLEAIGGLAIVDAEGEDDFTVQEDGDAGARHFFILVHGVRNSLPLR